MEYPWKEVIVTETPVFKDSKIITSGFSENCTINLVECIRNEPDVCMAEYFIHIIWTRKNADIFDEIVLGPYYSPALNAVLNAVSMTLHGWDALKR